MPAVFIRQLENLEKILQYVTAEEQRQILIGHADMILRASEESVAEKNDRLDVQAAYDLVVAARDQSPHLPDRLDTVHST